MCACNQDREADWRWHDSGEMLMWPRSHVLYAKTLINRSAGFCKHTTRSIAPVKVGHRYPSAVDNRTVVVITRRIMREIPVAFIKAE